MVAIGYRHRIIDRISSPEIHEIRTLPFLTVKDFFALGSDGSQGTESDWLVTQFKGLVDGIVSQDQPARLNVCPNFYTLRSCFAILEKN
jgi:hypothetical protein